MSSKLAHDGDEPPRSSGYGRPPVDHQIQQGEVRNPHGRRGKPKPPVDFLDEVISLLLQGKKQQITRRRAMDYFLFNRAAKGDVKAITMLEARANQRKEGQAEESDLQEEERAAFDRFVQRYSKKQLAEKAP